jgi:hypothetical protein
MLPIVRDIVPPVCWHKLPASNFRVSLVRVARNSFGDLEKAKRIVLITIQPHKIATAATQVLGLGAADF